MDDTVHTETTDGKTNLVEYNRTKLRFWLFMIYLMMIIASLVWISSTEF